VKYVISFVCLLLQCGVCGSDKEETTPTSSLPVRGPASRRTPPVPIPPSSSFKRPVPPAELTKSFFTSPGIEEELENKKDSQEEEERNQRGHEKTEKPSADNSSESERETPDFFELEMGDEIKS
jgi:hypothetical protein